MKMVLKYLKWKYADYKQYKLWYINMNIKKVGMMYAKILDHEVIFKFSSL